LFYFEITITSAGIDFFTIIISAYF